MKDAITMCTLLLFAAGLVGSLIGVIPDLIAFLMVSPAFIVWAHDMWKARA